MSDFDALLKAVKANPDDDTPRLVLADWLEENGSEADKARAEFIRVSCELAGMPKSHNKWRELYSKTAGLLAAHQAAWAADLPEGADYSFDCGFLKITTSNANLGKFAGTLNSYVTDMDITMGEGVFLIAEPISKEVFKHLSGLSHLGFEQISLGELFADNLQAIKGIKSFKAHRCNLGDDNIETIAKSEYFAGLTRLDLVGATNAGERAIVNSKTLELTDLKLHYYPLRHELNKKKPVWPWPEEFRNRLKRLDLKNYYLEENDKETVYFPELEFLKSDSRAMNLILTGLPKLKGLDTGGENIDSFCKKWQLPESLAYLNLENSHLSSASAQHIAGMNLPNLRKVEVSDNSADQAGILMHGMPQVEEWKVSVVQSLGGEIQAIADSLSLNVTNLEIIVHRTIMADDLSSVIPALQNLGARLPPELKKFTLHLSGVDSATELVGLEPVWEVVGTFPDVITGIYREISLHLPKDIAHIEITDGQTPTPEEALNVLAKAGLKDDTAVTFRHADNGMVTTTIGQLKADLAAGRSGDGADRPPITGTPLGASLAKMEKRKDYFPERF